MRWLDPAVAYLGDLLSPLRCAACDAALRQRALLCPLCASTVIRWKRGGSPIAFGHYGGALASALLRLKYGNRPDLGPALGQLLRPVVLSQLASSDVDLVVPVPVPYARLVERGYNQAALIARPLASALSARLEPRALARRDGSVKQASLNRRDRLKNLQGAFLLRDGRTLGGRRVLLVDDVSTTGATLDACRALLQEGGAVVHTAVVARTESDGL
jgi:ComF family protein